MTLVTSDISSIIADFSQPLTVTRRAIGTRVNGRYVKASPSVFAVDGAVVPYEVGEETWRLPEGFRAEDAIRIFSKTPMRPAREAQNDGDLISYEGSLYEVKYQKDWMTLGGFVDVVAILALVNQPTKDLYFGADDSIEDDDDVVALLTAVVSDSRRIKFTADAGEGEFIWFACPSAFGTPVFFFGANEGGFILQDTFDVGDVEYDLYKSVVAGLGDTEIRTE